MMCLTSCPYTSIQNWPPPEVPGGGQRLYHLLAAQQLFSFKPSVENIIVIGRNPMEISNFRRVVGIILDTHILAWGIIHPRECFYRIITNL